MSKSIAEPPKSGKGKKIALPPGIYVAARALAMGFPNNLGAHQFIFAIPESACFAHEQKLESHSVIVMGAYNKEGRLQPSVNSSTDVSSVRQYLAGIGGLDVARVTFDQVDSGISELIQGFQHYVSHEASNPISYPDKGGFSFVGCKNAKTYNSNSWAQSLVHYRLGPNLVKADFTGIDICNANRIPAQYFR